jgi:hypothetical protein
MMPALQRTAAVPLGGITYVVGTWPQALDAPKGSVAHPTANQRVRQARTDAMSGRCNRTDVESCDVGGRLGRWLTTAVLAAAVAGTFASPTAAVATATPTLVVTSTIAGRQAPIPLHRTAGWQLRNGIWSLDIRLLAPAMAETTVAMTWRSPRFNVRRGTPVLRDDIAVVHQDARGDAHVTLDDLRVCHVRPQSGCEPWFPISEAAPSEYTYAPPFAVSSSGGWDIRWRDKPARIYVEWRARIEQHEVDEAHDVVQVAFGTASTRLRAGEPQTCVTAQSQSVCRSMSEPDRG